MNFQVLKFCITSRCDEFPKSVIYVKSDRFLAVLYLMPNFPGTGYLVIACGSLTSSGHSIHNLARVALNLATKIKVRGVSRQRNFTMLCSSQLSSVRGLYIKCAWTVHQVCVDCSNIKDVVDLQISSATYITYSKLGN